MNTTKLKCRQTETFIPCSSFWYPAWMCLSPKCLVLAQLCLAPSYKSFIFTARKCRILLQPGPTSSLEELPRGHINVVRIFKIYWRCPAYSITGDGFLQLELLMNCKSFQERPGNQLSTGSAAIQWAVRRNRWSNRPPAVRSIVPVPRCQHLQSTITTMEPHVHHRISEQEETVGALSKGTGLNSSTWWEFLA